MVLCRWPAWKFFAMLGFENSIRTFFLPVDELKMSRSPFTLFRPYSGPSLRIRGITTAERTWRLKSNRKDTPKASGGLKNVLAGNYTCISSCAGKALSAFPNILLSQILKCSLPEEFPLSPIAGPSGASRLFRGRSSK